MNSALTQVLLLIREDLETAHKNTEGIIQHSQVRAWKHSGRSTKETNTHRDETSLHPFIDAAAVAAHDDDDGGGDDEQTTTTTTITDPGR